MTGSSERRVQATDRLGMIQSIGRLISAMINRWVFSVSILLFSPWLLLLLIAGIIPAFLGETIFAFLDTPESAPDPNSPATRLFACPGEAEEAAKELKLLIEGFLVERFTKLSNQIYLENVALHGAAGAGAFLSLVGTAGYYSAYVYVIRRTVAGFLTFQYPDLPHRAIFRQAAISTDIFHAFKYADQALFLTDLLAFFEMRPTIRSKPNALPTPSPILHGFEFVTYRSAIRTHVLSSET